MNPTTYSLWIAGVVLMVFLLWLFLIRKKHFPSSHHSTIQKSSARKSTAWIAENLLEERLESLRNNQASRSSVVHTLLASEVFVLGRSAKDFDPSDCSTKSGMRGAKLIPVYSSLTRLKRDMRTVSGDFSHVHTTKVKGWVTKLPSNYGLVLNPGIEHSIEMLPDDLAQLKLELS